MQSNRGAGVPRGLLFVLGAGLAVGCGGEGDGDAPDGPHPLAAELEVQPRLESVVLEGCPAEVDDDYRLKVSMAGFDAMNGADAPVELAIADATLALDFAGGTKGQAHEVVDFGSATLVLAADGDGSSELTPDELDLEVLQSTCEACVSGSAARLVLHMTVDGTELGAFSSESVLVTCE